MANEDHLKRLISNYSDWNEWRAQNPDIIPDLRSADLSEKLLIGVNFRDAMLDDANLNGADLRRADLTRASIRNTNIYDAHFNKAILDEANLCGSVIIRCSFPEAQFKGTKLRAEIQKVNFQKASFQGTDLSGVAFHECDFSWANLKRANLTNANLNDSNFYLAELNEAHLNGASLRNVDLGGAKLIGANLCDADIRWANISEADLSGANLCRANLEGSNLSETHLESADLTGCRVYAISAWNIKTDKNTKQSNLIITRSTESTVTVDELEIAQFLYLLLNRQRLRNVLDAITSKAVLLLGRFTPDRKAVLDALADELRRHNLVPIIFDFERSTNRDFTETIKILAGLSLFVIVDITKPKSAPQELTAIVPDYQIPFVPILEEGEDPYSMFVDFKKYDWVLKPILKYHSKDVLVDNFLDVILEPAWKMHLEIQSKKNEELKAMPIEEVIRQKRALCD